MFVRFWGTRGSLAKPGPTTVRYGGNTSCVELRATDGTLMVLDCGTGAHGLGEKLMAEAAGKPIRGHMFITHTHWDHIQGFPFFQPMFAANAEWDVYAPAGFGSRLQETLAGQMQYTYFPVDIRQLGATIRYHDLSEQSFDIGNIHITTRFLNHPALTLGYRFEDQGVSVVYATDHEAHGHVAEHPGKHAAPTAPLGGPLLPHIEDQRHAEFASGADLLIHDSQFTAEEYPRRVGYGHSTVEYVVDVAVAARARRLALFHHDVSRTDAQLDAVVEMARARVPAGKRPREVFAAAEGQAFELTRTGPGNQVYTKTDVMPVISPRTIPARPTIVYVASDEATKGLIQNALATEGFNLLSADTDKLAEAVHTLRPALVLLDIPPTEKSTLDLCRALRKAEGPHLPIMVTGAAAERTVLAALFSAGATDFLAKPFSLAYLRTRGRAWLMRTRSRWTPTKLQGDAPGRVQAVKSMLGDTAGIDDAPNERYDRITRLAGKVFDVPLVLFGLVDSNREVLKSQFGTLLNGNAGEPGALTPTVQASHTSDPAAPPPGVVIIDDLRADSRFSGHPEVAGGSRLRFYAGYPVRGPLGHVVGSLCILDRRPRQLSENDRQALTDLARMAEDELNSSTP